MTLDKCVQRLRKKITEESVAEAVADAANQMGGTATASSSTNGTVVGGGGRRGKVDRTPSFYTSRSIVNLSGLSVADPTPVVPKKRCSITQPSSTTTTPNSTVGSGGGGRSRSGSISVRQRTASGEEWVTQPSLSYSRSYSTNEFNLIHDEEGGNTGDNGDDFYNLEVVGMEMPLERVNSRRSSVVDDSGHQSGGGDDEDTTTAHYSREESEDNLKDPIHK